MDVTCYVSSDTCVKFICLLSSYPVPQGSVLSFPSFQKAPIMDPKWINDFFFSPQNNPKFCLNTFFLKKDGFGSEYDQCEGVMSRLH